MKRVIINADDFGLAPGVNRAIVELQQAGALTSSTLMAGAKFFSEAVHLSFAQPRLAVGCHVVLVDGTAVSRTHQVASLLKANDCFRPTVGDFLRDLWRGKISKQQLEAEAVAQIRRIQSGGLTVSHIDSHKHLHLFPEVLAPLLRAARQCGVPCVRNPFEPMWSVRATPGAGAVRRAKVYATHVYQRSFLKLVKQHGMHTTDGAIGVLGTGSLDATLLRDLLRAMPAGTWELVCHPGYVDSALQQANTRLLQTREVEREALLAVIPELALEQRDLALIDFHALGSGRR